MSTLRSLRRLKQNLIQRLDPRDPEACGPTGLAQRWLSAPDYAQKFQTTWHEVYPQLAMPRWRPVRYWGKYRPEFRSSLKTQIPPTGVLEIPGGQVMDIQGYTFGQEDYFLPDCSYHRDRLEYSHLPKTKYPVTQVAGRGLSLMSNASDNYCHFLFDCLPRLHLFQKAFQKAGIELNDMDFIHLPKPISDNAWSLIRQLGIDESKCIWAERQVGIQADVLYAATHPGLYLNYPRWVVDFWRTSVRCKIGEPQRRIYLPRPKGRRKVANEEELFPILERYGFEILAMEDIVDQPQLFHDAAAIVTSHGAALANLMFCQPGTKVLELISLEHRLPYFYALSQLAGLEHGCIFGPTIEPRPSRFGLCFHDFTINPRVFDQALGDLLA
jgi:hypothetical protein